MTTNQVAMEKKAQASTEGNAERIARTPVFTPASDVYEREDAVVLVCDMPGVSESNVDIHVENNVLTLRGKAEPITQEGFDILHREFVDGHYERVFTLSDDINRDAIKATIKNGVLQVVLPKAESAKPRKITVQVES